MSLDTQKFGISRYWLSVAMAEVPNRADIFSTAQLRFARKSFLAGKNQLQAIRSWLTNANIIKAEGRQNELTGIGKLMAAKDRRAVSAWTWWLFHLHLAANVEAFPYSTFFTHFDVDSTSWITPNEAVQAMTKLLAGSSDPIEESSVDSYFQGVEASLRPGSPLYGLGLVERRDDGSNGPRLRRRVVKPPLVVMAYAAMLFQRRFFPTQATIEMRVLLQKGLAKALGVRDADVREGLLNLNQDTGLSRVIQYKQTVNLDSVQFIESTDATLVRLASHAYSQGLIRWA
jgi:hypothetical protein